jgi:hypothetical protein
VVVVVLDVVLVFLLGVVLVVVHEHDLCTTARDDITGGLEDEEVGGVALEVNVGAEVDVGAPIAHARRERRPGDEASLDVVVGAIRDGARDDITGGPEDEEVGGVALEVNVGAEVDVGAPIVHARRERRPGDEASLDVDVGAIRDGARDDITGGLEVKRSVAFLAR